MPTEEDWEELKSAIRNKNYSDLVRLGPRFSPADINGTLPGYSWTPLTYSIWYNCSVPCVKHLIEAIGADPNELDGEGMSPLAMAVMKDNLELLSLLLNLNADPNTKLDVVILNFKL